MLAYIARRLFLTFLSLLGLSVFLFMALYLIGNPVHIFAHEEMTTQEVENLTKALGLDQSLFAQYAHFIMNIFKGDWGHSFIYHTSPMTLIFERLPASIELVCVAFFLAIIIALPLGIWCGLNPHNRLNKCLDHVFLIGFSLPNFWQGILLMMLFSLTLTWLPPQGRGPVVQWAGMEWSIFTHEGWRYILLPAINLAIFKICLLTRLLKTHITTLIPRDFIQFAYCKGISERRILWCHALKNIMPILVTLLAMECASLLVFSSITESLFAWPGIGKLFIDSLLVLDRPVIVTYLLFTLSFFILINFIVDLLLHFLDPRIRYA